MLQVGAVSPRDSVEGCVKGVEVGRGGLGQLKCQGSLRARETLLLSHPFQRRGLLRCWLFQCSP